MAPIMTAEDVVRRIAAECAYVDERGGVGIRIEPAAAIVRQYGEQFRRPPRRKTGAIDQTGAAVVTRYRVSSSLRSSCPALSFDLKRAGQYRAAWVVSIKSVFKNKSERRGSTVSGPFRSVQRSGRCGVGELLNGGCNPAPGIGPVVIAVRRELIRTG